MKAAEGKIDWAVKGRRKGCRQVWEQWFFICGHWNCEGSAASNECSQVHVSIVSLLILSFTVSFWRSCPVVGWMSSQCAEGRTAWRTELRGLWWMGLHLAGDWSPMMFLRCNSRASPVRSVYQWSGERSWMHLYPVFWWCQSERCCWHSWGAGGFTVTSR